jgi:hypothetical protein
MSKGKLLAVVVAVLATFYVIGAPYITVYQMRAAAENHDGEALSEHVDFPSVRQSLKDQMNAMFMKQMSSKEMKDNPFAALSAAFAGVMVDKMVDAYVTPAAITEQMKGEKPAPADSGQSEGVSTRKPFADASMSYESLNKFVVTVKDDSGGEGRFIFRRRGIDWKLTEILMPLEK